jgi:cold shock CspA family protein
MARSQQTWNKKEREKSKQKKRQDKEKKKEDRKSNPSAGGFDNMLAYVDENGQLTSTPPDPSKKRKIIAEQIETGVPRRENVEAADTTREGIVTFFNESKGFGFIKDLVTQESFFTHVNAHIDQIKENDRVSFQAVKGQKGLNAVDVRVIRT